MSSVIFQPLLHDPLGWKSSPTTYADTFKWRKYRSTSKDKKISTYGQQYQKQLRKQQEQQKLQQTNTCLSSTTNEEQIIQWPTPTKKNEENRGVTPVSYRCSSSKTAPAIIDEHSVPVVENKQRSASTNREATCGSRASQRSQTALAAAEETYRSTTSLEARRSPKEEKEKVITDSNNDNSRHWLTYPNPKTPQYLIDIKQRLGQLKIPSTLVRPTSATNLSGERQQKACLPIQRSESSISQGQQHKSADQRHFLDFNLPETPNELRAARHRLEKHRYNPSIDNYPSRPHTCPAQTSDISKTLTPPITVESKDEQLPPIQTTQIKDDAWTNDEENKTEENEASSIMIQPVDVDGLPNEYVEALETANIAQEEYLKNLKTNGEKKPDNCVYRLPSMSSDNKNGSFIAYRNQQQSTTPPNNNLIRENDFGTWVRNATDKERESAMKILHEVLNQPVMGYDIPTKQQTLFKQAPTPPPVRTSSATRRLGRTRTHQRIQCEICEKQLIKRHVWDLSRSDALTCPHQVQTIKAPIIPVRAS
ncbi:unnamed protein product [Rotaria sp. Silwood2]|nr:unnamed protein product [Rotaria sp. Silwood2]CAF2548371.1 unnamed protein product [Rotaria sp. Silwood2]CAF2768490.1 unnamed protein product [Rotaria sp. Silwood2]CAF2957009.1 unnamed protein product [Rotaria sp. Silwood2]CAF3859565.1 unnamed protein product [Rotaria sp. Silwood2]